MADLVGLRQLSERLGVHYRTAVQWRHRGLLPEPAAMIGRSPAWEWLTVERWAQDTGRRTRVPVDPGPPPKEPR